MSGQSEDDARRIDRLEQHQEYQNGERKDLKGEMKTFRQSMEKGFDKVNSRIDSLFLWFLGLLVTLLGALGGGYFLLWKLFQQILEQAG